MNVYQKHEKYNPDFHVGVFQYRFVFLIIHNETKYH